MHPIDTHIHDRVREVFYRYVANLRASGMPERAVTELLVEFITSELITSWQRENPILDDDTTDLPLC